MDEMVMCPVCGHPDIEKQTNLRFDLMRAFYDCPVCGRYEFTEDVVTGKNCLKLGKLGPYLYYKGFRKENDRSVEYRYHTTLEKEKCDEYVFELNRGNNILGHPVHVDNDIIDAWYPKNFAEKINLIMIKLDQLTEYVGQEVHISKYELYGLMFAERYKKEGNETFTEKEMNQQAFFFIKYLNDVGYIIGSASINGENQVGPISITPKGYQQIDQLQRDTGEERIALVAMQFGNETYRLREAIKQGIRDAGYDPILIDEVEHNELITPELLSYIKSSRFVVVDLTHNNNGAYFEEGYAMGIGKPVIQLCQKDTDLHFDIAQKNTIMWETESDIPLRLKNRIKATID